MLGPLALAAALAAKPCAAAPEEAQRAEATAAYALGVRHVYGERWQDAAAAFETAVALDPGLPLAHYGLGQARMALKRYSEAAEAFLASRAAFVCAGQLSPEEQQQAARRLDQEVADLRDSMRRFDRDRLIQGSIPWQEMNRGPGNPAAAGTRMAQEMERRLAVLERLRKRGLTARPPPEVSLALGSAYFQAGALADAEQAFLAALEADPRSGDAQNDLAVVYMLTGRLDQAERALKLAEQARVDVNPRLKEEIRKRRHAAPAPPPH